MKNYKHLSQYIISTIPTYDESPATGSHLIAWQEGFEPSVIEVQFNDQHRVDIDDALDIATDHMKELDRGQNDLPSYYHTCDIAK